MPGGGGAGAGPCCRHRGVGPGDPAWVSRPPGCAKAGRARCPEGGIAPAPVPLLKLWVASAPFASKHCLLTPPSLSGTKEHSCVFLFLMVCMKVSIETGIPFSTEQGIQGPKAIYLKRRKVTRTEIVKKNL